MRKHSTALVLASALVAAIAAAPALYAEENQPPLSGHGMMGDENRGGGMMGMMNMMKQMSQMMDHCGTMMQSRGSGRPNDQWRNTPSEPKQ